MLKQDVGFDTIHISSRGLRHAVNLAVVQKLWRGDFPMQLSGALERGGGREVELPLVAFSDSNGETSIQQGSRM